MRICGRQLPSETAVATKQSPLHQW